MTDAKLIESVAIAALTNHGNARWFSDALKKLENNAMPKDFYVAFAQTHLEVEDVLVSFPEGDAQAMGLPYPTDGWTLRHLCRAAFMLKIPPEHNFSMISPLFGMADMAELVALFKGLPLLPNARQYVKHVEEGVRANMVNVFDAIALHNPFPSIFFGENAWNQMVLKAVFLERPLFQVYGLEARANPKLAHILVDYARERRAANRRVTPELWRLVGLHMVEDMLDDLQHAMAQGDHLSKAAAAKAIRQSQCPPAKAWLATLAPAPQEISWDALGRQAFLPKQ